MWLGPDHRHWQQICKDIFLKKRLQITLTSSHQTLKQLQQFSATKPKRTNLRWVMHAVDYVQFLCSDVQSTAACEGARAPTYNVSNLINKNMLSQWVKSSKVTVYLYRSSPCHTTDVLPLPISRRWSLPASSTARQLANTARPQTRADVSGGMPVYFPSFRQVLIPACHRRQAQAE